MRDRGASEVVGIESDALMDDAAVLDDACVGPGHRLGIAGQVLEVPPEGGHIAVHHQPVEHDLRSAEPLRDRPEVRLDRGVALEAFAGTFEHRVRGVVGGHRNRVAADHGIEMIGRHLFRRALHAPAPYSPAPRRIP